MTGYFLVHVTGAHHAPFARPLPEKKGGLAENPLLDDRHAGLFRLLHVQLAAQRVQSESHQIPDTGHTAAADSAISRATVGKIQNALFYSMFPTQTQAYWRTAGEHHQ